MSRLRITKKGHEKDYMINKTLSKYMKKSSIFAAALAVIFVGSVSSCTNNQPAPTVTRPAVECEPGMLPIAYVNTDSLLTNYNFAKDLNEDLIKKTEDARANLNAKAASLEKDMAEFNRKLQTNAFLSQERAESEANRLQKLRDELEQLNMKLQNDLAQEQMVMNARLSDTIQAVLKKYNEEKKFELILSNTMHDNILIDNPAYDITNELVEILNARYAKTK